MDLKKLELMVAVLLLGLVAGCSSGGGVKSGSVEVVARNSAFESKSITVKVGTPIKLVLNNKDPLLHDFSIDKIPVKTAKKSKDAGHDMKNMEPDLHVSAAAEKSASVEFTPTQAGPYTYYCTVPGHKEAGMVGQLIVQ